MASGSRANAVVLDLEETVKSGLSGLYRRAVTVWVLRVAGELHRSSFEAQVDMHRLRGEGRAA